ncbi:chaperonin 10-like protein [Aspergillus cavernicola]|uniref:Chaperonin 10-like protein n=1 Tax=Aspergillus cavernicola TaxID=176166 RepID=A0ABR4I9S3_9EURO
MPQSPNTMNGMITDALVMRQFGDRLHLERVRVNGPGENEVLVEMVATGICHTDLICISGRLPFPTPTILGHEGAAIIRAVGKNFTSSCSPGDQVLLTFDSCGYCTSCESNHAAYCHSFNIRNAPSNVGSDGETHLYTATSDSSPIWGKFFGQSSFARHAVVSPRSIVNLTVNCGLILAREELQQLAPLGCGVQTGYGAVVNSLHVTSGSSLAVFGAGTVGLSAVLAARKAHVATIIVVDMIEERLEIAKELGATHVLLGSRTDLVQEIKAITVTTQGVQFAIDATGVVLVIETMMQSLGTMGKAVSIGMPPPKAELKIDINVCISRGQSYLGCVEGDSVPDKLIPHLVMECLAGQFPLDKMVTSYKAADCNQAIADMRSGQAVKPILLW